MKNLSQAIRLQTVPFCEQTDYFNRKIIFREKEHCAISVYSSVHTLSGVYD